MSFLSSAKAGEICAKLCYSVTCLYMREFHYPPQVPNPTKIYMYLSKTISLRDFFVVYYKLLYVSLLHISILVLGFFPLINEYVALGSPPSQL